MRIKVSDIQLTGAEKRYVLDAIERAELSWHGEYVRKFENAFSRYVDTRHAVSCCNGTAALHLALLALGIGPGDEVIVPALSYVATANAVRYCGAIPVFVDVHAQHWCMNVDEVDRAITPRTKAILVVQLYGHWPDMDGLLHLARRRQIPVVEDAAEALDGWWKSHPAGSCGVVSAFSFYANKTITCGEGGMVVTSDDAIAARVRHLCRQATDTSVHQYYHDAVGYNYRMTNLQAAVGLGQLEAMPTFMKRRHEVIAYYREKLRHLEMQTSAPGGIESAWMFAVLLPSESPVSNVRTYLDARDIETRPTFLPLPSLPMYTSERTFPVADAIARRGLCLPTHVGLSDANLSWVVACLNEAVKTEAIA